MTGSRGRPRNGDTGPTQEPGGDDTLSPSKQRPPDQRRDEEPFDVHIELVALDGEAGRELRKHQAAIMRKVLRWLHDNPANGSQDTAGTDEPSSTS